MKRIIPVLFIKNGLIVRSQNFARHQVIGNVINQAKRLNDWLADELICIDISNEKFYDSGRDDHQVKSINNIIEIIKEMSKVVFMPFSFGGGIRNVEDAKIRIRNGADKIIINTLIFESKNTVEQIVKILGSQAVVASLDYKIEKGIPQVYSHSGKQNVKKNLYEVAKYCEALGVGEIFIQNINLDGSSLGYDIEIIEKLVSQSNLPVVCCSGAGTNSHFGKVAKINEISGVAAGNFFNFSEGSYPRVKKFLKNEGIDVR
ncbi:MAG: imidazole glycerol phosphate synthase cyclase subunit [Candidatus Pelagibacter sp.]|nr:imidazole glycerol phosphate synthase cyclase subunit [Candidatus Pelagibacter sp.]|tara:strand:- start:837 stop:1616 length:780 start_codon:yes stop_codon:yes gene_type:complete